MKKVLPSLAYKVTMEGNLKILILKDFVMSMEFNITFQLLELLNKMGLLKGKIKLCKKWKEPCFMKTICQLIFGLKRSIVHGIEF